MSITWSILLAVSQTFFRLVLDSKGCLSFGGQNFLVQLGESLHFAGFVSFAFCKRCGSAGFIKWWPPVCSDIVFC